MNLTSTIFSKDNEIIQESFAHISKYSKEEIIITDEKLNIIYQNAKYLFKNNVFNIEALTPNYSNENLRINFYNFINSSKNHLYLKILFNDENTLCNIPMDVHICKIIKKNKLKGYSIIIQDITQEIKNKIQKETFIDILTHDLKNPMRANTQILELILNNKFGEIKNNLKVILEELLNSCRFMNYMADNLIIKYKNEFNLYELQKENCIISELIKEKVNSLSKVLERKKQTVELIINGETPEINIDKNEIGKVINNLIINASEQSIENTKIIIEIEKNKEDINISFSDFGYPKKRKNPNEIFEEYITCSNKFRKIGFSLELFNCRKIIEAHNGRIWAKDIDNIGSMISFSLPL